MLTEAAEWRGSNHGDSAEREEMINSWKTITSSVVL